MLYILSILGLLVIMCVGCNEHNDNSKWLTGHDSVRYVYSECNHDTVYIHDTIIWKETFGFPHKRSNNDTVYY